MTSYMKVDQARDDFENTEAKYLRERGWRYTSDNPACTWLWEKPLPDGRIVVVERSTAVSLQARADGISPAAWPRPPKPAVLAQGTVAK